MQERFQPTPSSSSTSSSSSNSSSSSSSSSSGSSRVFCVSDLHVDKAGGANMSWLQRISSSAFRNDVLIVAGDVADTAAAVAAALKLLSPRFARVVWLPGNHEAWLRPGSSDCAHYSDSFSKLLALRQMADECGVDVGPVEVTPGLIVLPLLSWYTATFDTSDPRPGSELGKAMGCCELQLQLEQVSSAVHVYGHSHINADMVLPTAAALKSMSSTGSSSSRRYVQYALDAVGAESAGLYCLWDGRGLAAPGTVLPITGL
ncbi:hypothetical protein OEZ85_002494 [Tetradesmus obliquus]|uniref:Calcineurin-like phosphoesterase domain-containing protein n=1 Tax=Tetradesmus obliquus TaxID=3088 RepID=A0ABY8TYG7_TETOB|nr:hypothetical protein OEZ85_002494 [Tetradesmus obliquus]